MGEDTTFDEINQKITTTLNLRHCAGIRATVVDILLAIHCSDDAEGRKGFLRLHTAGRQPCAGERRHVSGARGLTCTYCSMSPNIVLSAWSPGQL